MGEDKFIEINITYRITPVNSNINWSNVDEDIVTDGFISHLDYHIGQIVFPSVLNEEQDESIDWEADRWGSSDIRIGGG